MRWAFRQSPPRSPRRGRPAPGAALRVTVDGLVMPTAGPSRDVVADPAEGLRPGPGGVDLVVDLGYLDATSTPMPSTGRRLDPLAALAAWRSVVLAGGRSRTHHHRRGRPVGGVHAASSRLWLEMPETRPWLRFGDYECRTPSHRTRRAPLMRASIRYTAGDYMLAMRGEGPVLEVAAGEEVEYRELARRVFEHPVVRPLLLGASSSPSARMAASPCSPSGSSAASARCATSRSSPGRSMPSCRRRRASGHRAGPGTAGQDAERGGRERVRP